MRLRTKRVLATIVLVGILVGCGDTPAQTRAKEKIEAGDNSAETPYRYYDEYFGVVCYNFGRLDAISRVKVDEGTRKLGR